MAPRPEWTLPSPPPPPSSMGSAVAFTDRVRENGGGEARRAVTSSSRLLRRSNTAPPSSAAPLSSPPSFASSSDVIGGGATASTASLSSLSSSEHAHQPQKAPASGAFSSSSSKAPKPSLPQSPPSVLLPLLALCAAQTISSTWHVFGARSLAPTPYVSPLSFTAVRQLLSCIVLTIAARRFEGRGNNKLPTFPPSPLASANGRSVWIAGLCGGCLVPNLYLRGLLLTTPTVASVWDGPLIPVIVFASTILLGIERLSRTRPGWQIGSLALTVSGSILVLLGDFSHHKSSHGESWGEHKMREFVLGNVALLTLTGCYATMALNQKKLAKTYPPITLTSWMFGVGTLSNFILISCSSPWTGLTLWHVVDQVSRAWTESIKFRCGLTYVVCLLSAGAFTASSYASKYLDSSVVTLMNAAQPPITVMLEAVLFGRPVCFKKVVGMLMVVVGMKCFTSSKKEDGVGGGMQKDKKRGGKAGSVEKKKKLGEDGKWRVRRRRRCQSSEALGGESDSSDRSVMYLV